LKTFICCNFFKLSKNKIPLLPYNHQLCAKFKTVSKGFLNWFIFIVLSIIWGSSFMMIKVGLLHLTAFQVASLRIIFSGIVLLPSAIRHFKSIPKNKLGIVFMSGVLGSLLPAYLFCVAEMGIDGALTGTLNSLTPIFVIITGALFFSSKTSSNKIMGILIAFTGSILLLISKGHMQESQNLLYVSYVVLATIFYGFNVNMVFKYLKDIGSLQIASVALTLNAIPALIVLYFTGYFSLPLADSGILYSTGQAALLGILGTAIASIIFYNLVKSAGAVFASMVTYGIPIIANIWGIIYGEEVGWKQFACLGLILFGVYIANRKREGS